ncbi:DUF551 domain-containing protein [Phocaeicola sp.]|uniref:DUF551 domain-containing protein n=1 Tax=Phocaeicola sp. TaxID=2773926 RepID=UPI003AB2C79A
MKQSIVEVAYDYATEKTKFRKDVLKEVDADNYVSRHSDSMEDFQCGADWQAKQSPWINVNERLPDNDDDLYFVLDTKLEPPACGVCDFDLNMHKWVGAGGIIVYPTHWMPIPSLESNDNE